MPETPDLQHPKPKHQAKTFDRWSVRLTDLQTGAWWAIDDTRAACEKELAAKLDDWGKTDDDPAVKVEWFEHTQA